MEFIKLRVSSLCCFSFQILPSMSMLPLCNDTLVPLAIGQFTVCQDLIHQRRLSRMKISSNVIAVAKINGDQST